MNNRVKAEFDQYAETYTDLHRASTKASGEDPDFFASYKARYMARWLGTDGGAQALAILDFGCGVGQVIPHLREQFPAASLYGTDLSGESIGLASGLHPGVAEFKTIEGPRLPYESRSMDVVIAACVFHHIPPIQRGHWMSEIRRVLRPGGHVFVFEHNTLNPLTLKTVRDCPFDQDAILLPRRELLGLIKQATFRDVSSKYIVFFPHFLAFMRPLEPALAWLPMGAQYVVHGVVGQERN